MHVLNIRLIGGGHRLRISVVTNHDDFKIVICLFSAMSAVFLARLWARVRVGMTKLKITWVSQILGWRVLHKAARARCSMDDILQPSVLDQVLFRKPLVARADISQTRRASPKSPFDGTHEPYHKFAENCAVLSSANRALVWSLLDETAVHASARIRPTWCRSKAVDPGRMARDRLADVQSHSLSALS